MNSDITRGLAVAAALLTVVTTPSPAAADSGRAPGLAAQALPGSVDLGPALGEQRVALTLRSRDEAGLARFLADPHHPVLTPAGYQSRFGPSPAAERQVSRWADEAGLTVSHQPGSQVFALRAPAPVMGRAFHTEVHRFRVSGLDVLGSTGPAELPRAVDAVTAGVTGLAAGYPARTALQLTAAKPADVHPMGPDEFAKFYGVPAEPSGKGQQIAVIGWTAMDGVVSDLAKFEDRYHLPKVRMTVDYVSGKPDAVNDQMEWDLDTQYSTAMAPGVDEVHVYAARSNENADLTVAFGKWADEDRYAQGSASLGDCESDAKSWVSTLEPVLQKAEAQGQTLLAASGDDGTNCFNGVRGQRSYPAASAHAIAVGGTTITDITGHKDTGWPGSGGGDSALAARPSWQAHAGGALSGDRRGLPDLSFAATNYKIIDNGGDNTLAGTSASTPVIAGFLARVHEKNPKLGFIGPKLYAIDRAAYHDITTGNNGLAAGPGWDYVTGLGEPQVTSWLSAMAAG
ncbi:S53 family peptidase [Amycolatopsis sp. PS_44_ISF1]|uniref:S53 family peptidase n=1 Tax=Amycolatopsis sp. PS_44_ISF1 TaxID=2974917 RepID=UPI0028DF5871|nr:S53 family peptidase [Amycolatopsis sp. PS_44_ISF1]MDT8913063.1 S53 family peptidase [Amycolatopsis sp. PS_44_ISF1]